MSPVPLKILINLIREVSHWNLEVKMRSIAEQLNFIRTILVTTILISLISQVIPPVDARNDATTYTTILSWNHTEFLYWTLEDEDEEHILNCTLADGVVEPDVFEWTYLNGSEINATDVIYIKDPSDRSIFLKFVNITYDIADTFQCKSLVLDESGNKTYPNITNVSIFVQESRNLGLIIGMSAAAVVFFIIAIIMIKYL